MPQNFYDLKIKLILGVLSFACCMLQKLTTFLYIGACQPCVLIFSFRIFLVSIVYLGSNRFFKKALKYDYKTDE
jgi:hypothetical protein